MSFEPDDPSSLRGDIGAYSNLIRTVTCTEGEVDVVQELKIRFEYGAMVPWVRKDHDADGVSVLTAIAGRSEEHTSELQSRGHLVCRLLLEKKKKHSRLPHNSIP